MLLHRTEEFSFLVDRMSNSKISLALAIYYILMGTFGVASAYNEDSPADKYLSAQNLKEIIENHLAKEGMESHPAIDGNKKYPNCKIPLAIFPMFNSWSTIEVVCPDPSNDWKIMVRTRATHSYNSGSDKRTTDEKDNVAIIATKSLNKGHVITENDLEVATVKKSIGTGIFKKMSNLIGRKLKSNVSVGFPLRSRHLEPNWVIASGDEIEIVNSGKTITVSARGLALQNGQKGEKIRVKNLSSEKNLLVWVINEKKVAINAKNIGN